MDIGQVLLWIVFPYSVGAIVAMGMIWQQDIPKDAEEAVGYTIQGKVLVFSVKLLLLLSSISGLAIIFIFGLTDEPVQLLRWLLSMLQFQPDIDLVKNISLLSRAHLITAFLFLLLLAFTNKISYLFKPHLYVKRLCMKLDKRHP
ncbi:respiratory nitrate reductase subunit gamma [Mesobacillus zeae]|uniref:NarG-like domain-containing protein n=1 Tax=Mesobacillus zeae TaxID=1917180 RepID=A0A398B3T8_9BACI|nr:respiratory nitrate reductase subunit gamma [Mesobacillus zeae]RID84555.1 hypothetical protein D1970_11710 [Mesobacillus zeae]